MSFDSLRECRHLHRAARLILSADQKMRESPESRLTTVCPLEGRIRRARVSQIMPCQPTPQVARQPMRLERVSDLGQDDSITVQGQCELAFGRLERGESIDRGRRWGIDPAQNRANSGVCVGGTRQVASDDTLRSTRTGTVVPQRVRSANRMSSATGTVVVSRPRCTPVAT